MKRVCYMSAGVLIAYLLIYVALRQTGNLVIWDYGTSNPAIKTATGENPVCMLGIIYRPLMLIEWYHPTLHNSLTPN
jgi:hypothetical protein